jgi:hypothetical protein
MSALEEAVKAAQLYAGSEGLPIKAQQRLHGGMMRKIAAVARKYKISEGSAHDQISAEASRRGRIVPSPGKDY